MERVKLKIAASFLRLIVTLPRESWSVDVDENMGQHFKSIFLIRALFAPLSLERDEIKFILRDGIDHFFSIQDISHRANHVRHHDRNSAHKMICCLLKR